MTLCEALHQLKLSKKAHICFIAPLASLLSPLPSILALHCMTQDIFHIDMARLIGLSQTYRQGDGRQGSRKLPEDILPEK